MANGVLPIAPPLRDPRLDAVLVLEPVGGSGSGAGRALSNAAPAASIEVRLHGARLLPAVILATAESQVVFGNDDRRPLTLLCAQAQELFPSTPLLPGVRLAVSPPGPGQFDLRSAEYPDLHATLLVPRGPASRLQWSPLGEIGEARFDVPEGIYQARLFFLHHYIAAQEVTVKRPGPGGAAASEFVLYAVWPSASRPLPAAPRP